MRNLKRVLSLALAVVMVIGMMVMTTGAADSTKLADYDEITYVEAVDVMVALGVLEGDDYGYYNPEQILTREQAAKIICYMLLGPNNAEKLGKNQTIFADVAAGRWSAGFIAYCANLGIISGYDGKFDPAGELTGVAFGKMLLTALGYDANVEGYVGDNWATNIATDMIGAGIDVDGMVMDEAVSRDVAAQMAFNALTANTVYYSTKTEVNTGSANVTVSGGRYDVARNNAVDYRGFVEAGVDGYQQFCEKYFPKLTCTGSYDVFGRPTTEWFLRGTFIGAYLEEATLTYTKGVSMGDLYKALGLAKNVEVEHYYVDGKVQAAKTVARGDMKTRIGGNGVLTQVWKYVDDLGNVSLEITSINTYVAKVNTVVKATMGSERYITLNRSSKVPGTLNNKFETEAFAAKDLVTYTAAWNDSINKYDIITVADLTEYTTDTLVEWNGSTYQNPQQVGDAENDFTTDETYKYSAQYIVEDANGVEQPGVWMFKVDKTDLNVYCDEYGYAIYVSGVKTPNNYAALIGYGSVNQYGSDTRGATLLMPDGTKKEVIAKLGTQGLQWTDLTNAGTNLVDDGLGDIVTYTVDDKGTYTLYHEKTSTAHYDTTYDDANGETAFTNGKSLFTLDDDADAAGKDQTLYTTSETVFMVATHRVSGQPAKGINYNVYTGYAEMPSIDPAVDNIGIAYVLDSVYSKQINVVYIYTDHLAGISGVDTYFVKQEKHDIITDSTGSYYVVPAIENGVETTIKVSATCTQVDNNAKNGEYGLFAIKNVVKNQYGIIVSFDEVTTAGVNCVFNASASTTPKASGTVGTVAANEVVLGIGGNKDTATYWAYNDKTNVFVVDEKYKSISISDIASVITDANDLVYASNDILTKVLTDVVIVEQEDDVAPVGSSINPALDPSESALSVSTLKIYVSYVDQDDSTGDNAADDAATDKDGDEIKRLAGEALIAEGYTVKNWASKTSVVATKNGDDSTFTVVPTEFHTISINGTVVECVANAAASKLSEKDIKGLTASTGTGYISDKGTNNTMAYSAYADTTTALIASVTYNVDIKVGYVNGVVTSAIANPTGHSENAKVTVSVDDYPDTAYAVAEGTVTYKVKVAKASSAATKDVKVTVAATDGDGALVVTAPQTVAVEDINADDTVLTFTVTLKNKDVTAVTVTTADVTP